MSARFRSLQSIESGASATTSTAPSGDTPEVTPPPTRAEQIAELRARRAEVAADIDENKARVQDLTARVAERERQLADAQSRAADTEKKLFQMEEQGVPPRDLAALDAFVASYRSTAEANRRAAHEASVIEHGAVRNARPDTPFDDEIQSAPLVAAEPGAAMEPEEGLTRLKSQLAAAQALLEARQNLLKEIYQQDTELTQQQQDAQAILTKLKELTTQRAGDAAAELRAAVGQLVEAESLEAEARDLATNQGVSAANQAHQAAQRHMSDARSRQEPGSPDERLTMMAGDGFLSGHAATVEGDLHAVVAVTQAQRADDLRRHAEALAHAEKMGLARGPALVPEGVAPDAVPAVLTDPAAALTAAEESRQQAVAEAVAARDAYDKASSDELNDLWVVHTNIAAMHYLLAGLETDETAAKMHRQQALAEYQRATRDRADQPEAQIYQPIIQALSRQNP